MSKITYGGQSIVLEDPGHRYQNWLDRNLSLDDLRIFPSPRAYSTSRLAGGVGCQVPGDQGMGTPTWPDPPRPKLNTLWWPVTGATRWAVGLFLIDAASAAKIDLYSAQNLVLDDGTTTKTISLFALPARPANIGGTGEARGHILTLVDARYFWQWSTVGSLSLPSGTTTSWSTLFSTISASLSGGAGITLDPVDSAFGNPDPYSFSRPNENAAVMLDAAAGSLGRRVVFEPEGGIRVPTWSNAKTTEDLRTNRNVIAGGDLDRGASFPAEVEVVFPIYEFSAPRGSAVWKKSEQASAHLSGDVLSSATAGDTKTFHTTFQCDYSLASSEPDNVAQLNSLASALAAAYYESVERQYDASSVGIASGIACAYDDYIWYHFGHLYPQEDSQKVRGGSDYATYTRIASLPVTCDTENVHHQVASADLINGCPQLGRIDAAGGISSGSRGDVEIQRLVGGFIVNTGILVKVWNGTDSDLSLNASVWVELHHQSGRWYILNSAGGAAPIRFRVFDDRSMKDLNANVVGVELDETGTPIGADIGLVDSVGQWGPVDNLAEGWAVRKTDNPTVVISSTTYDAYEIVFLEGRARFVGFKLTEAMGATTAGQAAADTTSASINKHWGAPTNIQSPPSAITVVDRYNLAPSLQNTDIGLSVYDEQQDEYVLVAPSDKGAKPNILKCRVNESPSGVVPADATFAVDNISVITGASPGASIAAVQNTFSQTFGDNELIIIIQDDSSGAWEVIEQIGVGAGKVKVDAADTLDYLENQFLHTTGGAYDAKTDVRVSAINNGSVLDTYAAMNSVSGHWDGAMQVLVNDYGTLKWVTVTQRTAVVDYQLDGVKFQVRYQDVYALGTVGDWVTKHLGRRCPGSP